MSQDYGYAGFGADTSAANKALEAGASLNGAKVATVSGGPGVCVFKSPCVICYNTLKPVAFVFAMNPAGKQALK